MVAALPDQEDRGHRRQLPHDKQRNHVARQHACNRSACINERRTIRDPALFVQRIDPVDDPREAEQIAPDDRQAIDAQGRQFDGAKLKHPAQNFGLGMQLKDQQPCENWRRNDKGLADWSNGQERTDDTGEDDPKTGIDLSEDGERLNHNKDLCHWKRHEDPR